MIFTKVADFEVFQFLKRPLEPLSLGYISESFYAVCLILLKIVFSIVDNINLIMDGTHKNWLTWTLMISNYNI